MEGDNGDRQPAAVRDGSRSHVFRRTETEYSIARSTVAFLLLLGAFPLNAVVVLVLTALFLLPARFSVAGLGLLLLLAVVPLNDNSKWGKELARYIRRYVCGYFPVTLHVEDIKAFQQDQAYVFGCEPHSTMPFGFLALLDSEHVGFMPLAKVKFLASSAVFHVPFLRQIWTWMGFVPVRRETFSSYLTAGYSCILVPGGIREVIYMEKGSEVVYLKSRKGFVRIAMEKGRPLVPVFCFGQNDAYNWWKPCEKLPIKIARAISKLIMWTPVIYWGRFGSPIPFQKPMHVVVGRPVVFKKYSEPTADEVNEVHMRFIADLVELFEKYKTRVGHPDLHLRVVYLQLLLFAPS